MGEPRTRLAGFPSAAGLLAPLFAPPRASERDVETAARRVFAPHLAGEAGRLRRLWGRWRGTLRLLFPLGSVSLGNRVDVFHQGDLLFEAMWASIDAAAREVLLTTYTLEPDGIGRETLARLARAAERGATVALVLDAFGSHRLGSSLLEPLRRAGATVVEYNPMLRWPMLRWRTPLSRLVRNHRKILVVDGREAFAGGMNVAEEYAGPPLGTGLFRDTHLHLVGPAAQDLARLVLEEVPGRDAPVRTTGRATGAPEAADDLDGCLVQILESNVRRQRRAIQNALRTTIRRAVETCYLTSPYFVPPWRLKRALLRAAKRGVDVRVLTAGRSDVPLVHLASQHLYGRLLRGGVRVYEMQGRVLHAKTTTIDGVYASVGSFNLDTWSYRRNHEVNVSMLDRGIARELEAAFRRDLESSEEVTLDRWSSRGLAQRAVHWIAYQILRI